MPEFQQHFACGQVPHFRGVVGATANDALSIPGIGNGENGLGVFSQRSRFEVQVPLPEIPLKSALRGGGRLVQ